MRSGTATVPGADELGLGLTASLLLTALREHNGAPDGDLLAELASAQRWAAECGVEGIALAQSDLAPLRSFRESLRDALQPSQSEPSAAAHVECAVVLSWTPAGVRAAPRGQGWRRIAAAVSIELLTAQAADVLPRLKTCAYEPCGYPFVDSSRNRSRSWHDTAKCGNIVNLRASRARRASN